MRLLARQVVTVFAVLAFAAIAQAQEAQPEIDERQYTDWTVACAKLEGGGSQCIQMYHFADEDDGGAGLHVFPWESEEVPAVAVLTLPLGVSLTTGVILKVDRKEEQVRELDVCFSYGCISRFGVTQDELDDMKRGRRLNITVDSPDPDVEPYTSQISLRGFRRAFDQF